MLNTFAQQPFNVFIIERVIGRSTVPSHSHELEIPQRSQVVAHGRLTHREQLSQRAHIPFAVRECPDDLHARRITERLEGLGKKREQILGLEVFDGFEIQLHRYINECLYIYTSSQTQNQAPL